MDDLISRQAVYNVLDKMPVRGFKKDGETIHGLISLSQVNSAIIDLPSAQPVAKDIDVPVKDCISRQAAIDALTRKMVSIPTAGEKDLMGDVNRIRAEDISVIRRLPSAQPTIYGYNVEHLEMIARVLQKENLPPERVVEMLTDIGRIVAIVRDEFEETLRKAVEQCMT